jgi:hypothetical protein
MRVPSILVLLLVSGLASASERESPSPGFDSPCGEYAADATVDRICAAAFDVRESSVVLHDVAGNLCTCTCDDRGATACEPGSAGRGLEVALEVIPKEGKETPPVLIELIPAPDPGPAPVTPPCNPPPSFLSCDIDYNQDGSLDDRDVDTFQLVLDGAVAPGQSFYNFTGDLDEGGEALIDGSDLSVFVDVVSGDVDEADIEACDCFNAFLYEGTDHPCNLELYDDPGATSYDAIGEGVAEAPFRLYTPHQLRDMSLHVDALDKHYELCTDVSFDGFYTARNPYFVIGSEDRSFRGHFDGNHRTIEGFVWDTEGPYLPDAPIVDAQDPALVLRSNLQDRVGLFGDAHQAHIKNLILQDALVHTGGLYAGSLAGNVKNSRVEHIHVTGENTFVQGLQSVGGVMGSWTFPIAPGTDLSITSGQVVGARSVGGIAGRMVGASLDRVDAVDVLVVAQASPALPYSPYETGGLVGAMSSGVISNCTSTAWVDRAPGAYSKSVGGIVGSATWASVTGCESSAHIDARTQVGGIVGFARDVTVAGSHFRGTMENTGIGVFGGIIGQARTDAAVVDSSVHASLPPSGTSGGIVGTSNEFLSLHNTYFEGVLQGFHVGGLVGAVWDEAQISQSHSSGKINLEAPNSSSGSTYMGAGGAVGYLGAEAELTLSKVATTAHVQDFFTPVVPPIPLPPVGQPEFGRLVGAPDGMAIYDDAYFYSGSVCEGCEQDGEAIDDIGQFWGDGLFADPFGWDAEGVWQAQDGDLPFLPAVDPTP